MNRIIHFLFLLTPLVATAQMWNGRDTLYGNEWIRYGQPYFKIPVAADGIYRLPYAALQAAGVAVDAVASERYLLYHLGEEVPLYLSAAPEEPLAPAGYLEFYGEQNRAELDRYLFQNPDDEMLNPAYSLFTDTSAYFLTVGPEGTQGLRYAMMENDLANPPAPETWGWSEAEAVFHDKHLKRYDRVSGISVFYSNFELAEGFGSRGSNDLLRKEQKVQEVALQLDQLYAGGPAARLTARYACGLGNHQQVMRVNGTPRYEEAFTGFQVRNVEVAIPAADLSARTRVEFQGQVAEGQEAQSLAFVRLRYPRRFDFGGQARTTFDLPAGSGRRYLEISNLGGTSGEVVLYDPAARRRWTPALDNGLARVTLPADAGEHRLVLASGAGLQAVDALTPVTFIDYSSERGDFLLLSHPALFTDPNGRNQVQAYAEYRASAEGGGYRPVVVDVRQVYDQFGYGVARHAQALRNFTHFIHRNWPGLRYALILGKGLEYPDVRSSAALAAAEAAGNFYVPSFGYPASDQLMFSSNTSSVPLVPVGRIAANDPGEIAVYLRKVQALEDQRNAPQTIEGRAWMKRVIHLGGGGNGNEQQFIRGSLESLEREIRHDKFGGNVVGFYKTSAEPVQNSVSDQIFEIINDGASIITFFGHSSPGTFDFNIDNPDNYNNINRYPLMLSLGCYSGNLFTPGKSIGERFCFYEGKGAVAFGASRGLGFISALSQFSGEYYRHLGGDYYGSGIGDALQKTLQTFDDRQDLPMKTLIQQFVLHGDPAIALHPAPGPDFVVDPAHISFIPSVVTAQQDSFSLQFDILNLGSNQSDSMAIELVHQLPDGTKLPPHRDTVVSEGYQNTFTFSIANPGKEAVGQNIFFLTVDANDDVEELPAPAAEQNNALSSAAGVPGIPFFVVDNTARPVFPPPFAIVNSLPIILSASSTDALAPERTYVFEIDSTDRFDSPSLFRERIAQRGGVVKWSPKLNWRPGAVYYWRVSPEPQGVEVGYIWENSSFTYLPDSPEGWRQGHFWQWLKGRESGLVPDSLSRTFAFGVRGFNITIKNKLRDEGDPPAYVYNFDSPATSVRPWNFIKSGVAVVVGDEVTGGAWSNPRGGLYGSVNPSESLVFAFPTSTPEERKNLMDFLTDIIPEGSFVFLFTVLQSITDDYRPEEWKSDSLLFGTNLFRRLETEGAGLIRELENTGAVPYTFIYQKGRGKFNEGIAASRSEPLVVDVFIPVRREEGRYESPLVGPASSWEKLEWKMDATSLEPADSSSIAIIGINPETGATDTLVSGLTEPTYDLSDVDVSRYPFLRLAFFCRDTARRTAVNLQEWRVLFRGYPELAVNPAARYEFHGDTLQQGEELRLALALENVSSTGMDSLLVSFKIVDEANQEINRRQVRLAPVPAGDTLTALFRTPTENLSGAHNLILEANPDDDQAELFHFNNFAVIPFIVAQDQRNPLLDVTFDGEHILNGDLVSARPEIRIALQDENQFLRLADTSLFQVFLTYPEGTVQRVALQGEQVRFFPAGAQGANKATVEWTPFFTQSGIYLLRIQGQDASGNKSGQYDFQIRFEVIVEKRISNVLTYPNPFSTATQFVYTLTGDEPPAFFSIQIMTVSGRIVRELTQVELGPLKVGTHRTDFVWDGTDEFGDKLANGVYLYRVVAKDELGQDFESYDDGMDRFFDKGFGKLVILR